MVSHLRHRRLAWLTGCICIIFTGLFIADRAFPPPLDRAFSGSLLVTDRNGIPLRAFPTQEGRWRIPADLDKVDPVFIEALLEIEDKRFYSHWGVDGLAVMRAAGSAVQRGRIVSGASTITMQTARMLEPRPRNLGSKFIEMLRAFQLERRLSKDEILELYLTLTPYGGNLEGIRSASWAYFGREPDKLTDDQIALLIALPQSPEVRRPDLRPEHARAARALILDRMVDAGLIPVVRAEDAKTLPLPGRHAFPAMAWHASETVRSETLTSLSDPETRWQDLKDVRTSLDAGLQSGLETLVKAKQNALEDKAQIAALVIENDTRAVRAMVGSASRNTPGGWIDLSKAPRSPGSTLKPFIYGMAFDDGEALPNTFINDLPARFNTYRPENFDRSFRGQVRVSDALQHSLNVPAVLALERIGPERFASALSLSGVNIQVHGGAQKDPGLALALGGAGMTLRDLGMLYAGLGDGGLIRPLQWLEGDEASDVAGRRLISSDSSARLIDILSDAPMPEGRMPALLTQDAPEIAFKTGTSYGFRDAWAAGISRGFTVIVWVGRADGAPRPGATGRKSALPMLFDVFDRVDQALNTEGAASDRLLEAETYSARNAMTSFEHSDRPPVILFPPEEAVLLKKPVEHTNPGFVLSGRGESELRWFVDGFPIERDPAGAPIWEPKGIGFYRISAVDKYGRETHVKVRVADVAQLQH